ncbi:NfeD family protein [Hirschia baltica]|uniref:NfeD-like C-terminal domain-containing protein n=1 Tax=Hirschia baltica (strain ATCC 49814 / DSM 5838 / IFAM 1418) TaxID=582402 RepID=C6XR99_HIRBI|nr:NfeD family protein [Hirschia baltica]ACT58731.1 protein of unknown function DUF107 [Hirschia baltica ATCC 49814]
MDALFTELTVWHWIALAIGLLIFEMMLGTFDLLWIAIAAGITALYASLAPGSLSSWEYEVGVFVISSIILMVLGRTMFAGIRNPPTSHPNLNDRYASMIGKKAIVTGEFLGGFGRVKVNDSEWRAQFNEEGVLNIGDNVEIVSGEGSTVIVKPA